MTLVCHPIGPGLNSRIPSLTKAYYMMHDLGDVMLRKMEHSDLEAFYRQKNDPEVAALLGGFSHGYSNLELQEWFHSHQKRVDELLWTIVGVEKAQPLGHAGLYKIDHRIGSAEFAIMIGDPAAWGKGIGRLCTEFGLKHAFHELNLRRIGLSVLSTNNRAIRLYEQCGFKREGLLREAQYKSGNYVDVILMSMLRSEYAGTAK